MWKVENGSWSWCKKSQRFQSVPTIDEEEFPDNNPWPAASHITASHLTRTHLNTLTATGTRGGRHACAETIEVERNGEGNKPHRWEADTNAKGTEQGNRGPFQVVFQFELCHFIPVMAVMVCYSYISSLLPEMSSRFSPCWAA